MQIIFNLLLLGGLWYFWSQPKIGVIDPQLLVATQAELIAKNYPNGVPPDKLQKIAEDIKSTAINYAKKHHVLLLVKNVVWSEELSDHTDNILTMLNKE